MNQPPTTNEHRELRQLDVLAKLLDSQFKIPGTNMRFGLDAIVGLVPGLGDLSTLAVSGFMLLIMAKKGASGFLLARMALNVFIDFAIGSIPFLGDIFDFAFKGNQRNMRLMHEHYKEGRHQGSAWKVILPVLLVLFFLLALFGWIIYKGLSWLYALIS